MVKVSFFGSFREVVGKKEINIQAKTMEELVKKLIVEYEKMSSLLLEKKRPLKLRSYNLILINGRGIWLLDGIKTKLKKSDNVSIFPPVGGG
ncbi:MAG: MoaD family protein [Candidatus Thermoplasmatota archaeon]